MKLRRSGKDVFSLRFIVLFILVAFFGSFSHAQDDNVIELIRADVTEYDVDFLDAERVKGNVQFKHNNAFMDCDSAWFYRKENRIEAYGHIYIRQQDTLNLWGEYLDYNGDTKLAKVRKNVRLKDQKMTLETQLLEYDLENKIAYYPNRGKIRNGNDRLTSRVGRYYSRSRTFFFKDSVVLINPEYKMHSDTLKYNTFTKVAHFFGPTYIYSEENTIFCRYGWYDTEQNTSEFSKGSWIEGKENKLVADSMLYNRNTGEGEAFRKIVLIDTVEKIRIIGEYGRYHRMEKKVWISGSPMAVKHMDEDSLFLSADTLMDQTDTANQHRKLFAYHNSKLFKSDMQSLSDSLVYDFNDSTILLYIDPILWAEGDQITGDTQIIYRKNGELQKMDVLGNGFIVSEEVPGSYNQVAGRNVFAHFSKNKLNQIDVFGNGRSLYYAKDDGDSSYIGVNHIECRDLRIDLDSNRVREITFFTSPEGIFYPPNELPANLEKLEGFVWFQEKRPKLSDFTSPAIVQETSKMESVEDLLEDTVIPDPVERFVPPKKSP
jgi:lipopolysaccharide export system protein LptA